MTSEDADLVSLHSADRPDYCDFDYEASKENPCLCHSGARSSHDRRGYFDRSSRGRSSTMLSLRFLCRSALVLGIGTASLSAEEYPIKLDRPQKVGNVRRISASASRKMSLLMKSGEQTIKDDKQDVRAELVAVEKVLAVNETGRPTAVEYVVEKFECETPAGKHAIESGKVVTGKIDGDEERYELKDGAMPDEVKNAFELVATLPSQSSDDVVFGTDKPQAIGASWPVGAEKAVKDL